jgi:hypothetical protein
MTEDGSRAAGKKETTRRSQTAATVNLRSAQLNQSHQLGIQPGLRQIFFETKHCLKRTATIP